jgi:hypothetical protein
LNKDAVFEVQELVADENGVISIYSLYNPRKRSKRLRGFVLRTLLWNK